MKLRRLNQKTKTNQNEDGCNKKLEFAILQQTNVMSLSTNLRYFKSLQPAKTINIQD